jgi:transcriptional regulator with PAS, ATPase and Fis domain
MENLKSTGFIAKSQKMKRIEHLANIMSKVDSTVLLSGESGVGKGVISKYIHNQSCRCDGPFIKIDCSAIPENLFESEVFGYEKGAFTGAERSGKIGLLELANGGTVFLDEIGDMPIHMQPKILRAIQDREIIRVGGKDVIPVSVRFIAATNRDLKQMVDAREFREDLYYRLNVVPILIPPLRERKEDIIPLIQDITKKINERYGICKTFNNKEIEMMLNYDWPGNIRELENIIERIMVTEDGDFSLLQSMMGMSNCLTKDCGYKEKLEAYDRMLLHEVIKAEGSVTKAATKLGINATTIRRKLKKQIESEDA